jgi:hypothetical protein
MIELILVCDFDEPTKDEKSDVRATTFEIPLNCEYDKIKS